MKFPRSSGILLHPTSLPGRYGIGDLGEWAYRFVDFLEQSGQTIWQMLPLGPTSYGDSPYQSLSTFAGNTNLISLDRLAELGWLSPSDLADVPDFPADHVDFGWIIPYHNDLLTRAYDGFTTKNDETEQANFSAWCAANAFWLDDFALFVALKNFYGGKPWVEWDSKGETLHRADAVTAALATHARAVDEMRFRQWVFFTQWFELKAYANARHIQLIGDIPIFVAHDSSDVWANQDLFYLDDDGNPTVIAGVPPDYFSATGQRWGNPLYRWDVMAEQHFNWWIRRVAATLSLVDIVRIDHFRGFDAYWEIPASEPTAVNGRWVPAPGFAFLAALREALGSDLPIIAEDLGVITPGVEALRDGFNLPGMKVLQFAWGGRAGVNDFLPHNHIKNCVVYTGTHDNNTTIGWWNNPDEVDEPIRHYLGSYLGRFVGEINWDLIRLALQSVANTAVVPMQDILNLGPEARMNTPGKESGNWSWRVTPEQMDNAPRDYLHELAFIYGRVYVEPTSPEVSIVTDPTSITDPNTITPDSASTAS